jgi:hypothetical protein
MFELSNNKETRSVYNDFVKKFITSMTRVSLILKKMKKVERKKKLAEILKKSNKFLKFLREKYPD